MYVSQYSKQMQWSSTVVQLLPLLPGTKKVWCLNPCLGSCAWSLRVIFEYFCYMPKTCLMGNLVSVFFPLSSKCVFAWLLCHCVSLFCPIFTYVKIWTLSMVLKLHKLIIASLSCLLYFKSPSICSSWFKTPLPTSSPNLLY